MGCDRPPHKDRINGWNLRYGDLMTRPARFTAKPLADLLGKTFNDVFAKQGFASRELVTRWAEIVGPEVAAHAEPLKIQWIRPVQGQPEEPATLILRVQGPMALEIQHSSDVIIASVNRFLGWSAIGRLALRQAPLSRPKRKARPQPPDPVAVARASETLGNVSDDSLRDALARLSAVIKRT